VDQHQAELALAVTNRPGTPGRADELRRLEARAAELDAMTDEASADARRRTLLIELDVAGVLSGREAVEQELAELRLPVLGGYAAAARRLRTYLVSPERRRYVPDALAEDVVGARVSLDFFRSGPRPVADMSELEWTALGEALLTAATPDPTPRGAFYTQWDNHWYLVAWRRDDGNTPALLKLVAQ
jgi:hypothetical protein